MANQETFLRGLKINEKPLFPETVSPTDKLEHKLENGTVIRAVAEGSRIVGYTAHDSAGKSIPVFRLSMTDASPPDEGVQRATNCKYCICMPDGCQCWPEPCRPI